MSTVFDKTAVCLAARCIIVALVASVFADALQALADTAQNAFVSVTASGVRPENGRDFAVTGDVARVVANPGWRLRTPSEVRLCGDAPAVYRASDLLGENDADGNIDVVRTETEDVHVESPAISAEAICGGPYIIAYPASNKTVSVTFSASVDRDGLHHVTTRTYRNGEQEKIDGPEDDEKTPDVWGWNWTAGPYSGTADKQSFTTNLVFEPGEYKISCKVAAHCSSCGACSASTSAETNLLVSLLKVECNPWVGQDRAGDPSEPYESPKVVAKASLSPAVPSINGVEWTYEGDKTCDEFHSEGWTATLWSTSRDAHSETFLGDQVRATVLGASATTNFTVVAVDVTVDGVDETGEETEGTLVPYVVDKNSAITPVGTNALQDVKIVCEPKGQPNETTLGIKCSGFGELYEVLPSGELVVVEAKEYPAVGIESRRFVLHGHRPSSKFNDGKVAVGHVQCGARDKAQYTNFQMQFVTPAGDPVGKPADRGLGQNEFTFTDVADNGKSGMEMLLSVKLMPVPGGNGEIDISGMGQFDLPEISGTALVWKDGDTGEAFLKLGAFPPFTAFFSTSAHYKGYPKKNSDFGVKKAVFTFKGVSVEQEFEVFFTKYGKKHPSCDTCPECPNWFYYWRDGSVCSIESDMYYEQNENLEVDLYGEFDESSGRIFLSDKAAEQKCVKASNAFIEIVHHKYAIEAEYGDQYLDVNPGSKGAPGMAYSCTEEIISKKEMAASVSYDANVKGIACVASTVLHELCHKDMFNDLQSSPNLADWELALKNYDTSRMEYGSDSVESAIANLLVCRIEDVGDFKDHDGVRDKRECTGYKSVFSNVGNPDTYNLKEALSPTYGSYGDNEIRARVAGGLVHENTHYFPHKDWSNPGCQSKQTYGPK